MAATKEEIKAAIKEALQEERDEFWVPQPQHYMDHQMLANCRQGQDEWRKNHEFVSAVRTGMSWGKKASIVTIAIATITFIGGAIWMAIKAALRFTQ